MQVAPLPANEADRLDALKHLDVLDTESEQQFDALVKIASIICGAPISLITLVESTRQWFKANVGLPGVTETPRDVAFCAHAIHSDDLMEVSDAREDPRFADNPLVEGDPNIRFYAGVPLVVASGHRIGTLCVIDRTPSQLSNMQREVLTLLAGIAVRLLEGRRAINTELDVLNDLRASERRFRALADNSPNGVYFNDRNRNRVYSNRRMEDIWGIDEAGMAESNWQSLIHPEDYPAVDAQWDQAYASKGSLDVTYRILRPDGGLRYIRSTAHPMFDDTGDIAGYIGSQVDISAEVRMMQQLGENQERLRRLYESTQALMLSIDEAGRLVAVTDYWLQRMGYRREAVIGRELVDFLTDSSRQRAAGSLLPMLFSDRRVEGVEYQMVTGTGDILDVRLTAALDIDPATGERHSLAVLEDVTGRNRAERALTEAHERMTLAADSGRIGIWDWDLLTDTVVFDGWMRQICGFSDDEATVPLSRIVSLVHPDDQLRVNGLIRKVKSGEPIFNEEYRIVRADGQIRHLRGSAGISRDQSGRPVRVVGTSSDMTERRELASELATQYELMRVTLQSIGDAVITTDANGGIAWLNPVAERMTGWSAAASIGRPLSEVFHVLIEETRKPIVDIVRTCLARGDSIMSTENTLLVSRNGAEYGIEHSVAPIRSNDGPMIGVVLVFRDVTERRRLVNEMIHRASHDLLTELINRSEFEARLKQVLNAAKLSGTQNALIYLDLDQFKIVNDTCGHGAGDILLQQVARLFKESVRETDAVGRIGGDEFAIILKNCNLVQAQRIADGISRKMNDYRFSHDGKRFRVGVSIGLVPIDGRWTDISAIQQAADSACYAAKEAGRNRVHVWNDTDTVIRDRHAEMLWALRIEQALDEDRFECFAQRILAVESASDKIYAEVLIRMRQPDGALVLPGAFLASAERFNLVSRIDKWVIGRVVAWLTSHPDLNQIGCININLSGQSIGDRTFHRWVLDELARADDRVPARLCFEVTETVAVTNLADATAFFEALRAKGIRIALDDFGAGVSSFGYLKRLPVDTLKIDGQFIQNINNDQLDAAAVRCFVDVSRLAGLKTVAECVEDLEAMKRLTELGIDYAQGYLLHRPEPIARLLPTDGT